MNRSNYISYDKSSIHWLVIGFITCFLFTANNTHASEQGDSSNMTLFPLFIELGDDKHMADAVVLNSGKEKSTYLIDLIDIRVEKNGKRTVISNQRHVNTMVHNSAKQFLKISPRRIILEPDQKQRIRVVYAPKFKKETIADGEYRSHLRVIKIDNSSTKKHKVRAEGEGMFIRPSVHYALTIPVFIREGKMTYDTAITDMKLTKDGRVDIFFRRSGNSSVKGNIQIIYQASSGEEHVVKHLPGVAIYYPAQETKISTQLDLPDHIDLKDGVLKVLYSKVDNFGGQLLASYDYHL